VSSYVGKYAEYYNLIYADKPYKHEAEFVHRGIQRHSAGQTHRLLELACGTGRHARELEELGYAIVATDYSKDLLAVARNNAKAAGSRVEFRFGDMRTLEVGGGAFDAVYCLFDSIGYVQTNEAILSVLHGARKHLRGEGLLLIEFWHAAAMLRNFEHHRERDWELPSGSRLHRTSDTTLHVAKQLAQVEYVLRETTRDGEVIETKETQVNRYFLVQEMGLFLTQAGFAALEWLPAYEDGGKIDENTWHILVVARRA
jgi:SAM-dependent methyltransferase